MTLTHLLAAALVVCSLPAVAQDGKPTPERDRSQPDQSSSEAVITLEPWRIIPNQAVGLRPEQSPLDRIADQYSRARYTALVDALDAGPTCYAIRSYVVARDSKDSDSTHPAGYSTCRPSERYQVRTAEMRVQTADH
jgi:hypothetical protein